MLTSHALTTSHLPSRPTTFIAPSTVRNSHSYAAHQPAAKLPINRPLMASSSLMQHAMATGQRASVRLSALADNNSSGSMTDLPSNYRLDGKIALVTGGSRGIGMAIAKRLASLGATVVATATSERGADNISQYLGDMEAKGEGVVLNVNDQESIESTIGQIKDKFGGIDILVNNAGITDDALAVRMTGTKFRRVVDTNLNAVFDVTSACLPTMLKQKSGKIINIASVVAASGNPGQINYAAAKGGVLGMTRVITDELGKKGINANSVLPGFIASDMTKDLPEKAKERINAIIPMQRMGQPEEIADAVGFLASDAANYINGVALHVNGGMYKSQ